MRDFNDTEGEAEIVVAEDPPAVTADCYSAGERDWMIYTQQLRGRVLRPFLTVLNRCGIKPDHLTLISLVTGLLFCPLFFWWKELAFGLLLLHVLLDGLDGPLARHLNVASRRGSFTDTICDQSVIAGCTITLMFAGTIGIIPGTLYVFLYTVVVLFAMVRNALKIPYSWLVRPRFAVYLWLLVETYLWPGTIDYVLWGFNVVLLIKMLTGFLQIRKRI